MDVAKVQEVEVGLEVLGVQEVVAAAELAEVYVESEVGKME